MALCYGSLSKQTQSTRRGKYQLMQQYLGRKRINGEFIVKINILCLVVLQNKMSWEEQASKGHNNYYLQLFPSRAPLTVVWRLPPCGQGWIVLANHYSSSVHQSELQRVFTLLAWGTKVRSGMCLYKCNPVVCLGRHCFGSYYQCFSHLLELINFPFYSLVWLSIIS